MIGPYRRWLRPMNYRATLAYKIQLARPVSNEVTSLGPAPCLGASGNFRCRLIFRNEQYKLCRMDFIAPNTRQSISYLIQFIVLRTRLLRSVKFFCQR